jgi:hypothetical protein
VTWCPAAAITRTQTCPSLLKGQAALAAPALVARAWQLTLRLTAKQLQVEPQVPSLPLDAMPLLSTGQQMSALFFLSCKARVPKAYPYELVRLKNWRRSVAVLGCAPKSIAFPLCASAQLCRFVKFRAVFLACTMHEVGSLLHGWLVYLV